MFIGKALQTYDCGGFHHKFPMLMTAIKRPIITNELKYPPVRPIKCENPYRIKAIISTLRMRFTALS